MKASSSRTRVLRLDAAAPDPEVVKEAAVLLRRGGLVAFPTETVYGLGANLEDPQAVQMLYQVKQRPFRKQVTIHLSDARQVNRHDVVVTPLAQKLMDQFWPGPLTLVLSRSDGSTVGFRIPDHPVALELIRQANVPVVAPSANRSGNPPPQSAQAVLKDLQDDIDMVLDAGVTGIGEASTVLSLAGENPEILRAGPLDEELKKIL